jgi:hypothetical protein
LFVGTNRNMSFRSACKNWCFTLNNYTDADIERLSALSDCVAYLVFGKEVGDNGTPHLQGFVSFKSRIRMGPAKAIIGERAHLEITRDVSGSIKYCKKDGDFTEIGEVPGVSGRRTDLMLFKEAVKAGLRDKKRLYEEHAEVMAKYPRFAMDYIRLQDEPEYVPAHMLRPWQEWLVKKLEAPPNDREIIFIVDFKGNSGKTWFSRYYGQTHENSQIILPGKVADMAYALETTSTVIFMDAPRSKQGEFIQYDFLEHMKNGLIFSPKYESVMKRLKVPHVVVFMNESPDMTKLSLDRYTVCTIQDNTENGFIANFNVPVE